MKNIPILKNDSQSGELKANSFTFVNETNFDLASFFKIINESQIIKIDNSSENLISLRESKKLDDEQYTIKRTNKEIEISASTYRGLLHGISTLIQSSFFKELAIDINDKPNYPWRGVSWDISRHFFEKDFIKKHIFTMFLYKLNKLQLHLTDDQGWRIEIKSLPLLTKIGSRRIEAGKENGGFLTQEDIKEIVSYANTLGIEVIPEIDMPGHTLALTHSYPELLCDSARRVENLEAKWGVSRDVVCISNPKTIGIFKQIIDEVAELFNTTNYFHIGGDECPSYNWTKCTRCSNEIKNKGHKDPWGLQKDFALEIIKYISQKGKKTIVWDDLVANESIPGVMIEGWREWVMKENNYLDKILDHDDIEYINMPNEYVYFDYYQNKDEPMMKQYTWATTLTEKVFEFDPLIYINEEKNKKKVKGSTIGIWTERMETEERFEYQVYPRALIFANNLWTGKHGTWEEFKKMIEEHEKLMDKLNIHYFKKGGKFLELAFEKAETMDGDAHL